MIDSGYEEAMGAFIYRDGRYIKPHSFNKGALKTNQTFSIPAEDAAILSLTNPEIRDGNYIYVDSHFVYNQPKYVTENLLGETVLTRYALTHMDECCLIFDLTVKSSNIKERYYSECYLNRDEGSTIVFEITYNDGYQHATQEKQNKLLEEQILEENRMYMQLPNDYRTCLEMVREWRGLTYNELEAKTMLNERTIRRIINGEANGSLESLVLICLALKLPKISSHNKNSPHSFNFHNNSHIGMILLCNICIQNL